MQQILITVSGVRRAERARRAAYWDRAIPVTVGPMDKIMIVTGASRGIGAQTAVLAAGQGYAVCVNYLRNRVRADEVVQAIRKSGGQAMAIAADVAREHETMRMYETVDRGSGR